MNIHSEVTERAIPGSITFPSLVQLKINPSVKVWALQRIDGLAFAGVVVSAGDSNDHKVGHFEDAWSPSLWEHSTSIVELELSN